MTLRPGPIFSLEWSMNDFLQTHSQAKWPGLNFIMSAKYFLGGELSSDSSDSGRETTDNILFKQVGLMCNIWQSSNIDTSHNWFNSFAIYHMQLFVLRVVKFGYEKLSTDTCFCSMKSHHFHGCPSHICIFHGYPCHSSQLSKSHPPISTKPHPQLSNHSPSIQATPTVL